MKPGIPSADLMSQFHHVFWCGDLNYRLGILPADSSLQPTKEGDEDEESDDEDELATATSAASTAVDRPVQEDLASHASFSAAPVDPAPATTSTSSFSPPVGSRSSSAHISPSTSAEGMLGSNGGSGGSGGGRMSSAKRLLGKSLTPKGLNAVVISVEGMVGSFRGASSGELKTLDKVSSKK